MKKRSFFLTEVLIGIGLILSVAISIFSLEQKMAQEVKRAAMQLQISTAYNRALVLLIEKLSTKEIPFSAIERNKEIEYDLDYMQWRAKYVFKIKKSAPETLPKAFLIKSTITILDPVTTDPVKTGKFSFCISTNTQQGKEG